jgi:hypothetical protein
MFISAPCPAVTYNLYSVDQIGQVNIYVVQKNKWKHFENKYINKFQLTTIQNIPNNKLKILKAGSQKNIDLSPKLALRLPPYPNLTKKLTSVDAAQSDRLPAERIVTQGRHCF